MWEHVSIVDGDACILVAGIMKDRELMPQKAIWETNSTGPRSRVGQGCCEPNAPGGRPPWSFRPIRLGISTPDQSSSRAPYLEISVRSGVPPHHKLCRSGTIVDLMLRESD